MILDDRDDVCADEVSLLALPNLPKVMRVRALRALGLGMDGGSVKEEFGPSQTNSRGQGWRPSCFFRCCRH
jgi:hypothetical protein